jgi:3-hydroxyacyl-[acyl-carrier-protein] dehydratase
MAERCVIGFSDIKEKYLPHGYPMLMLDRIVNYNRGESIEAVKCITGNAPDMVGHYPKERSMMAGTNILQAFAQLAIVFFKLDNGPLEDGEMTLITSISGKFYKPAYPGDVLNLEARPKRLAHGVAIFVATATVNGDRIASGSLTLVKRAISTISQPMW